MNSKKDAVDRDFFSDSHSGSEMKTKKAMLSKTVEKKEKLSGPGGSPGYMQAAATIRDAARSQVPTTNVAAQVFGGYASSASSAPATFRAPGGPTNVARRVSFATDDNDALDEESSSSDSEGVEGPGNDVFIPIGGLDEQLGTFAVRAAERYSKALPQALLEAVEASGAGVLDFDNLEFAHLHTSLSAYLDHDPVLRALHEELLPLARLPPLGGTVSTEMARADKELCTNHQSATQAYTYLLAAMLLFQQDSDTAQGLAHACLTLARACLAIDLKKLNMTRVIRMSSETVRSVATSKPKSAVANTALMSKIQHAQTTGQAMQKATSLVGGAAAGNGIKRNKKTRGYKQPLKNYQPTGQYRQKNRSPGKPNHQSKKNQSYKGRKSPAKSDSASAATSSK